MLTKIHQHQSPASSEKESGQTDSGRLIADLTALLVLGLGALGALIAVWRLLYLMAEFHALLPIGVPAGAL